MKVELLDYTKDAEAILIFTKRTRRNENSLTFEETKNLSEEEKAKEIEYIFNTISGPWEFVDYTFHITGVTRGFTHELVRQRVGVSFAQESMRIADKQDFEYLNEISLIDYPEACGQYDGLMLSINDTYKELVSEGIPIQEARGILPTNILTATTMKINLRALNNMLNIRLCVRTAPEYQSVARELREKVLDVHPWAEPVLLPYCLQRGMCYFPRFQGCPLKAKFPWLSGNKDSGIARTAWEKMGAVKLQPK